MKTYQTSLCLQVWFIRIIISSIMQPTEKVSKESKPRQHNHYSSLPYAYFSPSTTSPTSALVSIYLSSKCSINVIHPWNLELQRWVSTINDKVQAWNPNGLSKSSKSLISCLESKDRKTTSFSFGDGGNGCVGCYTGASPCDVGSSGSLEESVAIESSVGCVGEVVEELWGSTISFLWSWWKKKAQILKWNYSYIHRYRRGDHQTRRYQWKMVRWQ